MGIIEKLKYLTNNEKKALIELKEKILKLFPVAKLIFFGSKARGDLKIFNIKDYKRYNLLLYKGIKKEGILF